MNKYFKYFLISITALIFSFLILIISLLSIIYFKGLSLDPFNEYIGKNISNFEPGSELTYKNAIVKYNKQKGFHVEADQLIYLNGNNSYTFNIDSLLIDFDFLSLITNPNQDIRFNIDKIEIFDPNLVKVSEVDALSAYIENESSIKLDIKKISYLDPQTKASFDYLSADIRNKKDTILNIGNIRYEDLGSKFALDLISSLIRLDIKSIMNFEKSNFYVKSELSIEDGSSYNFEAEFHQDKDKLIINEFIGDDIYLSEQGDIVLLEGLNKISVKLDFRAKADAFNQLIGERSDLDVKDFIDGFIGWQNFNLKAVFSMDEGHYQTVDDSSLNLSGIYDFRKVELPDSLYAYLEDPTIYDLNITKKKKFI